MNSSELQIDGWTTDLLDNLAERGSGHTPNKKHPEYWNGGIKWVSLADSSKLDKVFISETDKEISQLGIDNSSATVHPKGTVILSRDAGVGKSAILAQDMAVSQHFMAWRCNGHSKIDGLFLYYWLQMMKPEFERVAIGSTIKTIGLPYFKKLRVTCPCSIDEQRKIAQILSCWDDCLAKIEQLSARLRRRREHLIRSTLRPFLNHIGNSEQMVSVSLGEVFQEIERPVEWNDDHIYELVSVRRRSGGLFRRERLRGSQILTKKLGTIKEGDFLISKMQVVHGALSYVDAEFNGMQVSGSYVILSPRQPERLRTRLFHYLTALPEMYQRALVCSYGVHIEKMTFKLSDYLKTRFCIPKSLDRQDAIVQLFNSLDREIQLVESKIVQIRNQKQALMEKLITGKIRIG